MAIRCWLLLICIQVAFHSCIHAVKTPMGYHAEAVGYDGFELLRRLGNNGIPEGTAPEFDCLSRYLAYNVSLKMQPSRAPMKEVWDSLQLTPLCNMTFPGKKAEKSSRRAGTGSPDGFSPVSFRVFVDYKRGDDRSPDPSNEEKPLRTVHFALQVVREWRRHAARTGRAGSNRDAHLTTGIVLRGGLHYLNETLDVTSLDRGLVVESYPNETAIICGGKPLETTWVAYNVSTGGKTMTVQSGQNNIYGQVGSPGESTPTIHYKGITATADACQQMCSPNATGGSLPCNSWTWHGDSLGSFKHMCYHRSDYVWAPTAEDDMVSGYWQQGPNIWVADIGDQAPANLALGLYLLDVESNEIARATRARFPNIISPETTQFPNGWIAGGVDWGKPKDYGKATTITIDVPSYDLNPLFTNFGIGRGGPCSIFTPPESYWCSDHAEGGGPHMFESPSGITFDSASLTNGPYNSELFVSSAVLHTFRPAHWSSWMFEFENFNPETMQGNFSRGGFQGARGASTGAEWWLDNVFEELDFPNEYFYHRSQGKLYYFQNGTGKPNTQFVAANLKTLVNIIGTKDDPVLDVLIQNVVLSSAAYTYMDPHGVPSGGDWALQRAGAVFLEGTKNTTIRNCVFRNLDGNALFLSGSVHDTIISNNEFTLIGDSAIAAWGYTNLIDGTSQEQPRRTLVAMNYFHEIGLLEKQASCWFQAKSAQTRLVKNICFNGPRAGVNFNDGFGGANVMEDNVLFNLCRESSDHAPFNSWDRQPFLTEVANPDIPSLFPAMNNFTHNFVIGFYGSSMCFDNDDGSAYYHHSDNYLIYGGHKSNFYGHDKISTNNYNIYPRVYQNTCFRMSFPAVNRTHADSYINCTCVLQGVPGEEMYAILPKCDLDSPETWFFITANNTVYSPTGKASLTICGKSITSSHWSSLNQDPGTMVKVSPDIETIIGWGKSLFGIE